MDKKVLGEVLDIDEKVLGKAKALLRDLEDSLVGFESDPDGSPNLGIIEKGLQPIEELISRRMRLLRTGFSEGGLNQVSDFIYSKLARVHRFKTPRWMFSRARMSVVSKSSQVNVCLCQFFNSAIG